MSIVRAGVFRLDSLASALNIRTWKRTFRQQGVSNRRVQFDSFISTFYERSVRQGVFRLSVSMYLFEDRLFANSSMRKGAFPARIVSWCFTNRGNFN